jgi:hypothetical protein
MLQIKFVQERTTLTAFKDPQIPLPEAMTMDEFL